LPEGAGKDLASSAVSDKEALKTALQLYKLEDTDIQTILDSYDDVSGSLTRKHRVYWVRSLLSLRRLPDDENKAKDAIKGF
jgi:hypothetical protein